MKSIVWLRIAAVLMFLFAVGHTFGFLTFRPPTAEGRAVWASMNNVSFSVDNATFSYGRFYRGFGLSITAFQLFAAWLAWRLGSMTRRAVADARAIAWGMCALQLVGVGLSLRYFSAVPAGLSVLVAICLAMAAVSMRQQTVA